MKTWQILLVAVIGLGVLLATALGWYAMTQSQPVSSAKQAAVRFVIPSGQATRVIAENLETQGLIKNALIFRLFLKSQGLESQLQAGSFEIAPSMTLQQIAETLTTGTNDIWITLPEGWRREEIAEYLAKQDLSAFDKAEFLDQTATLEGQLFPDTYLLPKQASTQSVTNLLVKTFKTKITQGLATELARDSHDFQDILVMASLVEREARNYEDMRLVAGVLWNRIDIGMRLEVDATLQYQKGFDKSTNNWWPTPLDVDRRTPSVFNTYLNSGLPPRPIANPGLNAFKATLNPIKTDAIFYIHADDGKMYTAKTLDEHNRNIEKYLR